MQHRETDATERPIQVARLLVDANVDSEVGEVMANRAREVAYVVDLLAEGTPDAIIDEFARRDGWIIVSHDRRFMKLIQQPRYNFDESVTSGYGRIMLSGPEPEQRSRMEQVAGLIEHHLGWAYRNDRRFLISIGSNWVRYDDRPLPRT